MSDVSSEEEAKNLQLHQGSLDSPAPLESTRQLPLLTLLRASRSLRTSRTQGSSLQSPPQSSPGRNSRESRTAPDWSETGNSKLIQPYQGPKFQKIERTPKQGQVIRSVMPMSHAEISAHTSDSPSGSVAAGPFCHHGAGRHDHGGAGAARGPADALAFWEQDP